MKPERPLKCPQNCNCIHVHKGVSLILPWYQVNNNRQLLVLLIQQQYIFYTLALFISAVARFHLWAWLTLSLMRYKPSNCEWLGSTYFNETCKTQSCDADGLPIYDFILLLNSNIWPKSPPLLDILKTYSTWLWSLTIKSCGSVGPYIWLPISDCS